MVEQSKQSTDAVPRALVHKQILDVARDDPQVSIEAIADEIGGANPDLVASVLEEYGDPASDGGDDVAEADVEANAADQSMTADDPSPETTSGTADVSPTDEVPGEATDDDFSSEIPDEQPADGDVPDGQNTVERAPLSSAQVETLRAVHRHPEATQEQLADELDVVRATISNRVNDVEGFDWQRRRQFVEQFFDAPAGDSPVASTDQTETGDVTDGTSPTESETNTDETAHKTETTDDETIDDETNSIEAVPEAERTDDEPPDQLTVQTVYDLGEGASDAGESATDREIEQRVSELETAVAALETTLEEGDEVEGEPELLHKAATAILDDERIDEGEAMKLLRSLL